MKNSADLGGCWCYPPRPLWITPSLICRILHILGKLNSIIALLFIIYRRIPDLIDIVTKEKEKRFFKAISQDMTCFEKGRGLFDLTMLRT